MGKVVDITEKLSFDQNPMLAIKGEEFEVNSDAKTMLEVMGIIGNESELTAMPKICEKLFPSKDRKRLDRLNLNFKDYTKVIECAMDLIRGDDEEGEEETHITT